MYQSFICPHCETALTLREKTLVCDNQHSFDLARQGYVNLLPASAKRSKDPGDSKDMVIARREWLSLGYYSPILGAVSQLLEGYNRNVLDAGCGEGYYTSGLADLCDQMSAIDISKHAILSAAKRYKGISFAVASNRSLPIATASQSAVLSLFGFPVESEFLRVLKPGGAVIHADAGIDHLIEFRRLLYPEIKNASRPNHYPSMRRVTELPVEYEINFKGKMDALSLLKMTPHYYRATRERLALWKTDPPSKVTVSVKLGLFVKCK